jgi:prefoldin subunit 5
MNEVIGFAAVIVSIFAGMLFNNSRFSAIDVRLDRMQAELNGRMDRMQADLSQFYRDIGRHDAKIETLEKKAS